MATRLSFEREPGDIALHLATCLQISNLAIEEAARNLRTPHCTP